MQRVTKNMRPLIQSQIIVLENIYDIPSEVFNNLDISPDDAIKKIKQYEKSKNQNRIVVFNNFPLSLKAFNRYKYLYVYDKEIGHLIERKIEINNNQIKIYIIREDDEEKINFEGNIFTTASSIIMVVENPVTGNSIVMRVQRSAIVGEVIPITYLGHKTVTNEETASVGFCSRHRVSKKNAIDILDLDLNKVSSFPERKNQIAIRLKDYETRLYKEELDK